MSLTERRIEITYAAVCDGCGEDEEVTVDAGAEADNTSVALDQLAEDYGWHTKGPAGKELLICSDCAEDHPALRDCEPGDHSWLPISTDGTTTVLGCTWCPTRAIHVAVPDPAAPDAPKRVPEQAPALAEETDPFAGVPTLLETLSDTVALGAAAHLLLRRGAWGVDLARRWGQSLEVVRSAWLAWAATEAAGRTGEALAELDEIAYQLDFTPGDLVAGGNPMHDPDVGSDAVRWTPETCL